MDVNVIPSLAWGVAAYQIGADPEVFLAGRYFSFGDCRVYGRGGEGFCLATVESPATGEKRATRWVVVAFGTDREKFLALASDERRWQEWFARGCDPCGSQHWPGTHAQTWAEYLDSEFSFPLTEDGHFSGVVGQICVIEPGASSTRALEDAVRAWLRP